MARPSITENPEYLKILKFCLKKIFFSSKDLVKEYVNPIEKYLLMFDYSNKKSLSDKKKIKKDAVYLRNKDIKLLNDKITNLITIDFIERTKIVSSKETRGKGRYSLFRINKKGIFDYFYKNYFIKDARFELSNSEKAQLGMIFGKEFESLLNEEIFKIIEKTHKLKFANLSELFKIIHQQMNSYLISLGLKNIKGFI